MKLPFWEFLRPRPFWELQNNKKKLKSASEKEKDVVFNVEKFKNDDETISITISIFFLRVRSRDLFKRYVGTGEGCTEGDGPVFEFRDPA